MNEENTFKQIMPIGRKLAKARVLRGISQQEFANKLDMSKSAVSRLENSNEIEEELLQQACDIIGVSVEGLKTFDEDLALSYTVNFYDESGKNSVINSPSGTQNIYPIEETIKFFEKELERTRREFRKELEKRIK